MIKTASLAATFALLFTAPAAAQTQLPPGIWTNTEDVYFAEEEGREKALDMMFEVAEDGRWRGIDAFGEPNSEWIDTPIPNLSRRDGETGEDGSGWQVMGSEIRRARQFSCWVSARKFAGKPDGSEDWTFSRGLTIFDQGGRVTIPGEGAAPDVTIRLRNVTWAKGSRNRPSFVLYVHKDDPVRAESYSWASPDAELIGINLRWVQASCGLVEEEPDAVKSEAGLVAAGQQWRALYETGDWETLRHLYADDAVLMTQGEAKISGADNIVTFLQRLTNIGASAKFQFAPEETAIEGHLGFVTARYRMDITLPGKTDPTVVVGRSFLTYKWSDDGWKLWRDMDNLAPDVRAGDFE